MTTLNKSDLQKFSEQSGLQVDGRSEFAYTDRLEHFSRLVRLNLELEIDDLKDQLAKANQLWQIAQGRCDGLEEKLAKADQTAHALYEHPLPPDDVVQKYEELLYEVHRKFPDETRHQTALRYIKTAESPSYTNAAMKEMK